MASEKEYCSVEDILDIAKSRGEDPIIVIADGLTDPYNLGALIRCAEGTGAHGIIIPKRRSTGLTPLVSRSSAGAIEHMARLLALKGRTVFLLFPGEHAAKSAYELGKAQGIDMPITEAAYKVLYEGEDVHQVVHRLLTRNRRAESEDAGWL